jgi:rare lipoprotein A (peptidoglycan hydrolase)
MQETLGSNGEGNCGSVCLADRRLAVLAHYSPKNSVQTYFSFRFHCPCAFAPAAVEAASSCGIASYYGPGFHGRTTANGERFDSQALTFAHRSLPFGTKVKVTIRTMAAP